MKIILVSSTDPYSKSSSGAEKLVLGLYHNLKNKHEVKLCYPKDKSSDKNPDFKIFKIKNKIFRKFLFDYVNPFNIFAFYKVLKTYKPDVVHFHNFYGISSFLAYVSSNLRFKTVITAHDYWPFCYWSTMKRNNINCQYCFNRKISNIGDIFHGIHTSINYLFLKKCIFVAPSRFMESELKKNNLKAIYIPNGINIATNITTYKKIILWAGRIVFDKGLQYVLPYINEFLNIHKDWNMIILGDGSLKNELSNKYKGVNFLSYQDPNIFYKKASIFINSSIWFENLSYSILEAMNYGVVPIVSKIGGNIDIIRDGKNGFLYNHKNPKTIIGTLEKIITNGSIKKIGFEARQTIKEKFILDKCIKNYENLYNKLAYN